ncbi:MAG: biotin/lipoate--protein ligase family protein [Pseudomonadota bacterium]
MSIAYDPAPTPAGAEPSFPPLFTGERVPSDVDPLAKAVAAAGRPEGVEAGTLFWADRDDRLEAALVLAPEAPLKEALAMLFAAANGLGDALGALSPPEVAVTWEWPDLVKVNGAACGVFRVEADARAPEATPQWLVIALSLTMTPAHDAEPGADPTVTALSEEGCGDIGRTRLLESWSRHTLVWINRWLDDGFRPIHDAWAARVEGRGEAIGLTHAGAARRGVFLGLDETGSMLLKTEAGVEALGLEALLNHPRAAPEPARAPEEAAP